MKNLIGTLLLLLLCGCGSKESTRSLEVNFGALSSTQPSYVYGQKIDGSERFGRKITSDTLKIPLTGGTWKFQVVTWASSSYPFEGNPVCGEAEAVLSSNTNSVVLNVEESTCKNSSWWAGVGYYESSYLMWNGLNVNFCDTGTTPGDLISPDNCAAFTSGVTGMKVIVPEVSENLPLSTNPTVSQCYSASSNNFFTNAKIPFGGDSKFPMYTMLKLFYGDASCSGANCCSGYEETYHFPRGLSQPMLNGLSAAPKSGNSIKLKFIKPASDHLAITASASAVYQSCNSLFVNLKDKTNTDKVADSNLSVALDCQGLCTFYSDPSCSSSISSLTVQSGTSSKQVYFRADSYKTPIKASVANYLPALKNVTTSVTYATIDADFLFSAPYISSISSIYFSPPFVASTTVMYETRDGNRGKMRLNSVSTTTVSGDTFDFDYTTYNSGGTIIASGSSQSITACFTGNCFLDLDTYPPVNSNTGQPFVDAWWENLSGSLYFNGQGSAAFMVLP